MHYSVEEIDVWSVVERDRGRRRCAKAHHLAPSKWRKKNEKRKGDPPNIMMLLVMMVFIVANSPIILPGGII